MGGACWRLPSLLRSPAGDPLQIMAEHAPADGTGPVLKALARQTREPVWFLKTAMRASVPLRRLHLSEQGLFVQALFQACWIFGQIIEPNATPGEEGFVPCRQSRGRSPRG